MSPNSALSKIHGKSIIFSVDTIFFSCDCGNQKIQSFCIYKRFTRFWICLNMADNALWQGSEYACSTFDRFLNKLAVLNMPGLKLWQGCEYARATQGTEYA